VLSSGQTGQPGQESKNHENLTFYISVIIYIMHSIFQDENLSAFRIYRVAVVEEFQFQM